MDPITFTAVLCGAAMHAGWNAIVKVGLDRLLAMTLVTAGAGGIALALVPFVPLPTAPAWVCLILSVLVHIVYKLCLIKGYQAGDLGQVYPIARGTAPLLVALAGLTMVGERLSDTSLAGVVLLAGGVCLLSLRGGGTLAGMNRRAVLFALATAVSIGAYTIVDGLGARLATTAHSYAVWFFVLDAIPILVWTLATGGRTAGLQMLVSWRSGVGGGLMLMGSYWIAIWAMSKAPIALVAALRETSVLFAAVIAVVYLKEPIYGVRIAAACVIVAGVILTRLG